MKDKNTIIRANPMVTPIVQKIPPTKLLRRISFNGFSTFSYFSIYVYSKYSRIRFYIVNEDKATAKFENFLSFDAAQDNSELVEWVDLCFRLSKYVVLTYILSLLYYVNNMLNTISARQIQREYKKVLENANKSKEPIIVMSNNKPLGAVIGLDLLEKLQIEIVLKEALKEYKVGKTKTISTPEELETEFEELKKLSRKK